MNNEQRGRPVAGVQWSEGIDGKDAHYYIAYHCPACGKYISNQWCSDRRCFNCCCILDWGRKPPRLTYNPTVEWDW